MNQDIKSVSNDIGTFRTELETRNITICKCHTGNYMISTMMSLGQKIARQLNVSDKGNKEAQKLYIDSLVTDICSSILHHGYFMSLATWKNEADGKVSLLRDDSDYFILIHMMIVTYFEENDLTLDEHRYFDEEISAIMNLFLSDNYDKAA